MSKRENVKLMDRYTFTDPLADELAASLRLLQLDQSSASSTPTDAKSATTERLALLDRLGAAPAGAIEPLLVHDDFARLLAAPETPLIVRTGLAKCTAELTKNDVQRRRFTEPAIVGLLAESLRQPIEQPAAVTEARWEYVIQVCRALGNILYQSDDARVLLAQNGGDALIIRLLDVRQAAVSAVGAADFMQFTAVRCGLIANFMVAAEAGARRGIELGVMERIERLLVEVTEGGDVDRNAELVLNLLPLLTILTENVTDVMFGAELNRRLVRLLGASTNADIAEMCLDLLHYQAENGKWKRWANNVQMRRFQIVHFCAQTTSSCCWPRKVCARPFFNCLISTRRRRRPARRGR